VAAASNAPEPQVRIVERPMRRRLADTRASITHKFNIGGHEGYLTVGLYDDGMPGELFITMAKEGSTIGGLMDSLGTAVSVALQYGVPVESLVNKFTHQRFEPAGMTTNRDIPFAKSLVDYIFRWMGMEFIPGYREANAPRRGAGPVVSGDDTHITDADAGSHDAPARVTPAAATRSAMEDDATWNLSKTPAPSSSSRSGASLVERATPAAPPRETASVGSQPIASVGATIVVTEAARATVRTHRSHASHGSGGGAGGGGGGHAHVVQIAAAVGTATAALSLAMQNNMGDAPACDGCGAITVRNGTCYKCLNCGNSMGCS
jgi:ribonucleoside-diphosphate reductase alpha chain